LKLWLFVNKGANQMADKIEDKSKFRWFAWGALICITILMPIAWQLKGIIALFVH